MTLSSCKKETGAQGPVGPVGPAGPYLKGTLIGYVNLFDVYGNLQDNAGGVQVSMEGLARTAVTDSTGRFELDSVVTGTYNLDFSISGYGSQKIISLEFTGGG